MHVQIWEVALSIVMATDATAHQQVWEVLDWSIGLSTNMRSARRLMIRCGISLGQEITSQSIMSVATEHASICCTYRYCH
jgi:hypothetical protein